MHQPMKQMVTSPNYDCDYRQRAPENEILQHVICQMGREVRWHFLPMYPMSNPKIRT